MKSLKIATWNINSVRLRMPIVETFLAANKPDVLCLQETKSPDEFFPKDALAKAGYVHQHFAGMKSYNGVAIVSKVPLKPLPLRDWCAKSDKRHVAAILPNGVEVHNFYVPAGGDIPDPKVNEKFAHKLAFVKEMTQYWDKTKDKKTPRILVGDLNIAPLEHDVWSHKQLLDVVSHTPIEVKHMNDLQASFDWHDAVRHFVPHSEKLYSWWSYRAGDWRKSDRGRRLDHIWVTQNLKDTLRKHVILKDARDWKQPSDHVPVIVEMKF